MRHLRREPVLVVDLGLTVRWKAPVVATVPELPPRRPGGGSLDDGTA